MSLDSPKSPAIDGAAFRLGIAAARFNPALVDGLLERLIDGLLAYLRTERMPVVGMDVLDVHPRKPRFVPSSGKAMVRRRASAPAAERVERERAINPRVVMAGWADLF